MSEKEYVVYYDYFDLVPLMSNQQFFEDFRMPLGHFHLLHEKLSHSESFTYTVDGKEPVNSEKCLLIGIWVLATPDSYRSIARRFAVSKSTIVSCVDRVIDGLLKDVCQNAMKLPKTKDEKKDIADEFEEIAALKINPPAGRENKKVFINRKKYYSINFLGVCDVNLFFT